MFTLLKYTMPAPFLGLDWADRVVGGPGKVAATFVEGWDALVVLGGALVVVGGVLVVVVCKRIGTSDTAWKLCRDRRDHQPAHQ